MKSLVIIFLTLFFVFVANADDQQVEDQNAVRQLASIDQVFVEIDDADASFTELPIEVSVE